MLTRVLVTEQSGGVDLGLVIFIHLYALVDKDTLLVPYSLIV